MNGKSKIKVVGSWVLLWVSCDVCYGILPMGLESCYKILNRV